MQEYTWYSFFFTSIPEEILMAAIAYSLCFKHPLKEIKKIILYGLILAVIIGSLNWLNPPFVIRVLIQLPILMVSFYLLFRVRWILVFASIVLSYIIVGIVETIVLFSYMVITETQAQIVLQSTSTYFLISYISFFLLLSLVYILSKLNRPLFRISSKYSMNKKSVILFVIIVFQTFLLVTIGTIVLLDIIGDNGIILYIIIGMLVVLQLTSFVYLRYIIRVFEKETELDAQKAYLDNINKLFSTIRSQRHDFINHVQVMYSFLILQQYEDLKEYMKKMMGEIKQLNRVIIRDNPALSALLQTNLALYEMDQIELKMEIKSNLSEIEINSIDLVRILGNLLNNAREAVMELPPSERKVSIEIKSFENFSMIKVTNYRPLIPENMIEKIFEGGFSTKKNHDGLGLAAVKQLVKKKRAIWKSSAMKKRERLFLSYFLFSKE
ncbi:Spo0B domain-containing protein [Microaerobacter geothermalis]|uniref:sensor histidine kinase n=1 Tax=Microaerobacter geothermalis TaxID=674972 RepID=UPI001F18E56E|nr:GHKL domain-containing protein [Microaerobacter geothermalis]MCF6094496.1 Spo0B domain-containing protein [Microaerobacter geothermalis]